MKVKFELVNDCKIGFKKLSNAELGKGNSHQTHIGLFDETVDCSQDLFRPLTAKFIYNNTVEDLVCLIDYIKSPDGKIRSPKIRKGNNQELLNGNLSSKSIVGQIREIVKNSVEFREWYLLWFCENKSNLVFILFNDKSKEYKDIFEIIPNIGIRGVIKNSDDGFSGLYKYIEEMGMKIEGSQLKYDGKRTIRSLEFWMIAFFLSKYGTRINGKRTIPPVELNSKSWKDAYLKFFDIFNDGQTSQQFINSLKNARDSYDSHIENSERVGWRDLDGRPAELPVLAKNVYNKYDILKREILWNEINELLIFIDRPKNADSAVIERQNSVNPNWTREELILALDLYFDMDQGQMHKGNQNVIRVSNEIRDLKIHFDVPDPDKFRNPSSIARRLGNFKTMDDGYDGDGLKNSSKLAKEVYQEFNNRRDTLRLAAAEIRDKLLRPKTQKESSNFIKKDIHKSDFLFQFHKNRECDPLVLKVKKEMALATSETLKCEICGFDANTFYGEIGNDVMEIHYNKELINEPGLESSSMDDFIIVCSNCHKVLDKNFYIINSIDLKIIIDDN
jgi:5-methylcytosine-specific restriction protein A